MKLVVAPDSFKGSVTSAEACAAIEKGIKNVIPGVIVVCKPIADGGEGTLDAIVPKNNRVSLLVTDPMFNKITAEYGSVGDTAVIEMACAAGLTLVPESKRNAGKTTTYGVGEMILHALKRGYKRIMLTAGGSATNDGGSGMLAALGAQFVDKDGNSFVPTGNTLSNISKIDLSKLDPLLHECEFIIATDVKNRLLGESGATLVYAPQKGLEDRQLEVLEEGMEKYSELLKQLSGVDVANIEGSGAGGGVAVPLLAFTNAKIKSGIETVLDVVEFDSALSGADAVITGEGRMDTQSLYGKTISGVTTRAKAKNIPVYCFVGCVGDDIETIKKMGIADVYITSSIAKSTEDSIKNAATYLTQLAECFTRGLE